MVGKVFRKIAPVGLQSKTEAQNNLPSVGTGECKLLVLEDVCALESALWEL